MSGALIVGCGFVGAELAKQWLTTGHEPMFALTRSQNRVDSLRLARLEPVVGHWHDPTSLTELPAVDVVVVSVPHREDSGLGIESHTAGLHNLLQKLPSVWKKLIYLSTTGVYGDAHDDVDELTPTQPTRIGPQIAVAAEQWLLNEFAQPAMASRQLSIVRLAGIYGPGRVPLAEKLRLGEPLSVPQAGWLNLAHVGDIAAMLMKLIERKMRDQLYVFSDGHPVPRLEFYRTLANLCGVNEPQFIEPDPSAARSQRAGAKRVNPHRLLNELQMQLQFPSYREGLADCLKHV